MSTPARLHSPTRFRRRWIARHLAALALAVGVLVVTGPSLIGSPSSALAWFVVGGWLASLFTVGLFGIAAIAVPFLVGRIAAVVRTDDLAGYERNHQPWWESAR
mgnify:CR=1 FL=1